MIFPLHAASEPECPRIARSASKSLWPFEYLPRQQAESLCSQLSTPGGRSSMNRGTRWPGAWCRRCPGTRTGSPDPEQGTGSCEGAVPQSTRPIEPGFRTLYMTAVTERRVPPPQATQQAARVPGGWVYEIDGSYGPDDSIPPERIGERGGCYPTADSRGNSNRTRDTNLASCWARR